MDKNLKDEIDKRLDEIENMVLDQDLKYNIQVDIRNDDMSYYHQAELGNAWEESWC